MYRMRPTNLHTPRRRQLSAAFAFSDALTVLERARMRFAALKRYPEMRVCDELKEEIQERRMASFREAVYAKFGAQWRTADALLARQVLLIYLETLHPTPYTLQPTPYTLHPTPYTLHPSVDTRHPTPYILHPSPHSPHPAI